MRTNRRNDDRTPFDARVTLTVLSSGVESTTFECVVVDYSAGGVGIRADRDLAQGTPIRLKIGEDTFIGTVRFCRKDQRGFYSIGLKLSPAAEPPSGSKPA